MSERVRPVVLVVDNEPRVALLLQDVLSQAGFGVDTARDGQEALQKIGHGGYSAVLADVHMPGMDGVALYRTVSQRHPELRGRFIFMTADVASPRVASLLHGGEISCLTKPFAITEVAEAVRRALTPSA